jgi:hypothetical protein
MRVKDPYARGVATRAFTSHETDRATAAYLLPNGAAA